MSQKVLDVCENRLVMKDTSSSPDSMDQESGSGKRPDMIIYPVDKDAEKRYMPSQTKKKQDEVNG